MLSPVLFLQLSFSENGPYSSSEEKEKVAATRQMCYGKKVGFGSQSMKIAKHHLEHICDPFEIVFQMERCFRYRALP